MAAIYLQTHSIVNEIKGILAIGGCVDRRQEKEENIVNFAKVL